MFPKFNLKKKCQIHDIWYITSEDLEHATLGSLRKLLRSVIGEIIARKLQPEDYLAFEEALSDGKQSLRFYKTELIRVSHELELTQQALDHTSRKLNEVMQERYKLQLKAGEIKEKSEVAHCKDAMMGAAISNGDIQYVLKELYGFELPAVPPEGTDLNLATMSELMSQLDKINTVMRTLIMASAYLNPQPERTEENG